MQGWKPAPKVLQSPDGQDHTRKALEADTMGRMPPLFPVTFPVRIEYVGTNTPTMQPPGTQTALERRVTALSRSRRQFVVFDADDLTVAISHRTKSGPYRVEWWPPVAGEP